MLIACLRPSLASPSRIRLVDLKPVGTCVRWWRSQVENGTENRSNPRGEQNSLFRCSLAERSGVLSADQPGKCRHSSLGANPPQRFAMPSHEAIQVLQVQGCGFLRFPENHIAFAHRDFSKHLSCRIV